MSKYLDSFGSFFVGQTMRHFSDTSRTVEGLKTTAHEVHVKGTVDTAAIGHNGNGRLQAAAVLLG